MLFSPDPHGSGLFLRCLLGPVYTGGGSRYLVKSRLFLPEFSGKLPTVAP